MRRGWFRAAAVGILLLGWAAPIAAQGIPLPRVAIYFTARQGRWTLLTSWTLVFATQNRTDLAIDAARHALRLGERAGDERKIATSLHYLAVLYGAEGDDRRAEACIRRALAIRERTLGSDDPAVADELVLLARVLARERRFDAAAPLLERALTIRGRNADAPGPVVDLVIEQAELFEMQRMFSDAEQTYRRAVTAAEQRLPSDDPALTTSLAGLASVLRERGRAAEALPLSARAIDLTAGVMGSDDPALVPLLRGEADAYERLARSAEARTARARADAIVAGALGNAGSAAARRRWEKLVAESMVLFGQGEYGALVHTGRTAVQMAEALFGPDDYRVSVFLVLLGAQTEGGEGDFARAETYYRRAVRIAERAVGTEDPGVAEALLNFSLLYEHEMKEQLAEATLRRVMSIQERIMALQTSEDPLMHSPRINLALLLQQQGRFDEAERLLQDALAVLDAAKGPRAPHHYATSQLLLALAGVRERQRRYPEAEPLIRRAVDLTSTAWGIGWGRMKKGAIANALSQLAYVYTQQERFADAERTYRRIIALDQHTGTRGGDLRTRDTLARLYAREGKTDAAVDELKQTLARAERLGLRWQVHQFALSLAAIHLEQGRYGDAEPLVRQALAIEQDAIAPDSPEHGETLFTLAAAVAGAGRTAEAESLFLQSFDNLRAQVRFFFTYMSESDRVRVLDTMSRRFAEYFSFVDRTESENPEAVGRMYDLVLWRKGLVVRSIEALRSRVLRSDNREALALLDELAARRAQLAAAIAEPAIGTDAAARNARVFRLREQANTVEQRLVAVSPAIQQDRERQGATWTGVRQQLTQRGADAAIEVVQFPAYDRGRPTGEIRYVALVLTPASPQPMLVRLGNASSLETGLDLANAPATRGDPSVTVTTFNDAFYEAFWKPIESIVGSARRVYVAPDGVLNQMAFGLTPMPDGRLLMDAYDLRLVNSTADLLRPRQTRSTGTALLVGNPRFTLTGPEYAAALAALDRAPTALPAPSAPTMSAAPGTSRSRAAGDGGSCLSGELKPLEYTETEVNQVFDRLRQSGWNPEPPYTGDRALEEVVKRARHPRVVHLATHGFFCRQASGGAPTGMDDPMLQSGLFFAGSQTTIDRGATRSSFDDGVLTAYEASLLDLQGTELVVLSACSTGLGKYEAGEGVFGLRRAFQEAGAEAVLMSMWAVPDRETEQLMMLFYSHWLERDEDKHDALRNAQHDLRALLQRSGRDSSWLWGAFVLVGP